MTTDQRVRVASALCLAFSGFFFWTFYERYLKWDFNEDGRYYDAQTQVVYTASGIVWILPALAWLIAAVACLWLARRHARKQRTGGR